MSKLKTTRNPIQARDLAGDDAREIVEYADKVLHSILVMKIDGWLTGEYDLPDQQDLLKTAIDYWACRHKARNGIIIAGDETAVNHPDLVPKAPLTSDHT